MIEQLGCANREAHAFWATFMLRISPEGSCIRAVSSSLRAVIPATGDRTRQARHEWKQSYYRGLIKRWQLEIQWIPRQVREVGSERNKQ